MTTLRTEAPPSLLALLDGLVALVLVRFAKHPAERERALAETDNLADAIAETGDRLTASGNFRTPADRRARGELLAAMATCLALGAEQPGGITWAGAHWCTAPHPNCPKDDR
ncbi:hypothetical protein ACFY1A_21040 [Streptomyces sp. NPDC001520]|uniref:hypothetical protein n=1 Tax=Streptomyces sp. NPDC001520 TaxID=3364581 RepID=UPI0036C70CAA